MVHPWDGEHRQSRQEALRAASLEPLRELDLSEDQVDQLTAAYEDFMADSAQDKEALPPSEWGAQVERIRAAALTYEQRQLEVLSPHQLEELRQMRRERERRVAELFDAPALRLYGP